MRWPRSVGLLIKPVEGSLSLSWSMSGTSYRLVCDLLQPFLPRVSRNSPDRSSGQQRSDGRVSAAPQAANILQWACPNCLRKGTEVLTTVSLEAQQQTWMQVEHK